MGSYKAWGTSRAKTWGHSRTWGLPMASTPQRTCVLCWGQSIWRTGTQDTALWRRGRPSLSGCPLLPLSAPALSTLPQQVTLICTHSLCMYGIDPLPHIQTSNWFWLYISRQNPWGLFLCVSLLDSFLLLSKVFIATLNPLFNTCVYIQYAYTVYFSRRVLCNGHAFSGIATIFSSGFSFQSYLKAKKDSTSPSRWK